MDQQFRNITYLSDRGGTGFWRHTQQMMALNCISQGLNLQQDCVQIPILDQNYYRGMTSITCQRWISDQQKDLFCKFFKPIMDANSGWLMYAIDDNMSDECIPKFNRGRHAFEGEKIQGNIREMLNTADFVVTTTKHLKEFYHNHYGVPLENIIAVPNLLPKWWFGGKYDPIKKVEQFNQFKNKPRIGIVSSLSHYNIDNVHEDKNGLATRKTKKPDGTEVWINEKNEEVPESEIKKITDDFDEISRCVRETVNDFQWVFFGYCPPQVQDLADKKKIEVYGGSPILNYSQILVDLKLQAIVAAIKPIEFNLCKSHIKYIECCAIGVPLFATKCLPYTTIMEDKQLFTDQDDLKDKLMKLKFSSSGAYRSMIENQWKVLNSPVEEGDFKLKNFWLDDNLNIWIDMFRLRQKSLKISLNNFIQQYNSRKDQEAKNLIAKSESGDAQITL